MNADMSREAMEATLALLGWHCRNDGDWNLMRSDGALVWYDAREQRAKRLHGHADIVNWKAFPEMSLSPMPDYAFWPCSARALEISNATA